MSSGCRNRTGPSTGMSDRTGIGTALNRVVELSVAAAGTSTWEYRKLVSPTTSTLSTTPTMTWLTWYVIAKRPSTSDTSAPASSAASRPMTALCVIDDTTAAVNAAPRSWASIAMLTTPARSPMTPPSAPYTNGTDQSTAPPSRPTTDRSRGLPAPAQARNPVSPATA